VSWTINVTHGVTVDGREKDKCSGCGERFFGDLVGNCIFCGCRETRGQKKDREDRQEKLARERRYEEIDAHNRLLSLLDERLYEAWLCVMKDIRRSRITKNCMRSLEKIHSRTWSLMEDEAKIERDVATVDDIVKIIRAEAEAYGDVLELLTAPDDETTA
jgi:hypothetical protein